MATPSREYGSTETPRSQIASRQRAKKPKFNAAKFDTTDSEEDDHHSPSPRESQGTAREIDPTPHRHGTRRGGNDYPGTFEEFEMPRASNRTRSGNPLAGVSVECPVGAAPTGAEKIPTIETEVQLRFRISRTAAFGNVISPCPLRKGLLG